MSDTAATRRPPPTERRTQAIDAFIDLLLEGRMPKPEDVADRADLSIATLYRYFSTLDELRHDAMTRVLDRYPNLFTVPERTLSLGDPMAGALSVDLNLDETQGAGCSRASTTARFR